MRTRNQDKHVGEASEPPREARHKRRRSSVSADRDSQQMQTTTTTTTTTKDVVEVAVSQEAAPQTRGRRSKKPKQSATDDATQNNHEDADIADSTPNPPMQPLSHKNVHFTNGDSNGNGVLPAGQPTKSARRITMSPSALRRVQKTDHSRRASLPPLSGPDSEHLAVQEYQFSPLRQVLSAKRIRRLRRSHMSEAQWEKSDALREAKQEESDLVQTLRKEIYALQEKQKGLALELATHEQFHMDVIEDEKDTDKYRIKEMEAELATLKAELAGKKEQLSQETNTPMSSIDEEESSLLIDPRDLTPTGTPTSSFHVPPSSSVSYPTLPAYDGTDEVAVASQVTLPDADHEEEIRNFENLVKTLTQKAADVEGALQAVRIELEAFGFTSKDATAIEIVAAMRKAFRETRKELEQLLPGETPVGFESSELLPWLLHHIRKLLAEVQEKEKALKKSKDLVEMFKLQSDALLDKLADAENREGELKTRFDKVDFDNENKEKKILDLEEDLGGLEDQLEDQAAEIAEKDEALNSFRMENDNQAKSIEKLNNALESYREELKRAEELIVRIDEESQAKTKEMETNHAEVVSGLQGRLEEETSAREAAETEVQESNTLIENLEQKVSAIEADLESMREQVQQLKDNLDTEQSQREAAEAELDQKTQAAENLEAELEGVKNELEETKAQVAELQGLKDTEHSQREAAEAELDKANEKIEKLNEQIHHKGVEANELRQKLFEAQLAREKTVKEIKQAAADRQHQLEEELATEKGAHQGALDALAERDQEVAHWKIKLTETEKKHDALIEKKNGLLRQLEGDVNQLEKSLKEQQNTHANYAAEMGNKLAELQNSVNDLTGRVTDSNNEIVQLRKEALEEANRHDLIVVGQEQQLRELQNQLANSEAVVKRLEHDNDSLERRVESEAEAMLDLQNHTGKEIQGLKNANKQQAGRIAELENEAQKRTDHFHNQLQKKDAEMHDLHVALDARVVDITKLSDQNKELKKMLKAQIKDSERTAEQLNKRIADFAKEQEEIGHSFSERSHANRQRLEELDTLSDIKVKKVNEKLNITRSKKNRDSALHIEDGEMEMA